MESALTRVVWNARQKGLDVGYAQASSRVIGQLDTAVHIVFHQPLGHLHSIQIEAVAHLDRED